MEKRKYHAIFRSVRYDAASFLRTVWQFALIMLAFILFWRHTETTGLVWPITMISAIIPMAIQMQRYTVSYSQLVGYGLTKRSFLLGGLLAKPMYMLFAVLMVMAVGLIEKMPAGELGACCGIAAMIALFAGSYGDLAGAMILRWNRVGFVLYMILFIGLYFIAGVFMGILSASGMPYLSELVSLPSSGTLLGIITAVSLVLSALFHVIAALLLRRVEVKG